MEELDRIYLIAFDCFIAKILVKHSKQQMGIPEFGDDPLKELVEFVSSKQRPYLTSYLLRRLVDYNLVSEALVVAQSDSDTLTLLDILVDKRKRLLFRLEEYADLREMVSRADSLNCMEINVSASDIENLESRCCDMLSRANLDDSYRVWKAYINFYLSRVGSPTQLESRILNSMNANSHRLAITLFKALEVDEMGENSLLGFFSNIFLMDLLRSTISASA